MYTKQNFENGQVLSAEQLIKIEDGIINLSNNLSTIPTKISDLENDSGFLTSIPETLPNPNALTINGNSYDGTKAVDITEQVNILINLKLEEIGVAEEVVY